MFAHRAMKWLVVFGTAVVSVSGAIADPCNNFWLDTGPCTGIAGLPCSWYYDEESECPAGTFYEYSATPQFEYYENCNYPDPDSDPDHAYVKISYPSENETHVTISVCHANNPDDPNDTCCYPIYDSGWFFNGVSYVFYDYKPRTATCKKYYACLWNKDTGECDTTDRETRRTYAVVGMDVPCPDYAQKARPGIPHVAIASRGSQ